VHGEDILDAENHADDGNEDLCGTRDTAHLISTELRKNAHQNHREYKITCFL